MLSEKKLKKLQTQYRQTQEVLPIFFNALSDSNRFKIFKVLLDQGELCVTEVAMIFGFSVPAASQQLKILENSGLVERERMGQTVCFRVRKKDPLVKSVIKMISKNKLGF